MSQPVNPPASLDNTTEDPVIRAVNSLIIGVFLLAFLYLLACLASSIYLTVQVPISDTDAKLVSFLAPRLGLQYHGLFLGGMIGLLGLGQLLSLRVSGLIPAVLGLCAIFATSETTALRLGILNGDMKVGCFSYESAECRKMLGLPEGDAKSIYRNGKDSGENAGWADWYATERASMESKVTGALPSTFPGVAFLQAPIIATSRLDDLKERLQAQKAEIEAYVAADAKH